MLQIARLVGEVEVAAPSVIAFDPIGRDRFLEEGEGVQARLVQLAAAVTVALEQGGGTDLEARMDHAAVAAARAPTKLMLFQQSDRATALRQARRRHHSCVAAADNHHIDLAWKWRLEARGGRGFAPPVGLLAIVRSERGYAWTLTPCQKAT